MVRHTELPHAIALTRQTRRKSRQHALAASREPLATCHRQPPPPPRREPSRGTCARTEAAEGKGGWTAQSCTCGPEGEGGRSPSGFQLGQPRVPLR
eukprot:scaffold22692_cov23-Tisochrysis_lutea.AAC.3